MICQGSSRTFVRRLCVKHTRCACARACVTCVDSKRVGCDGWNFVSHAGWRSSCEKTATYVSEQNYDFSEDNEQRNANKEIGFPPLPNANSYLSPKTFTVAARVDSSISRLYTQTVGMYWSHCVVSVSNSAATYLQKRYKFHYVSTCNPCFDAHRHSKCAVTSQML
jgi:hypothetical protein